MKLTDLLLENDIPQQATPNLPHQGLSYMLQKARLAVESAEAMHQKGDIEQARVVLSRLCELLSRLR